MTGDLEAAILSVVRQLRIANDDANGLRIKVRRLEKQIVKLENELEKRLNP